MALVKAQCTNCGGTLDVDNTKDAAICPFCNTPYIVEKAIQQFNIHNTNYINNAVFMNSSDTEEELLTRGIKQLELNVWEDAGETFRQVTKLYPENYKGWLGLCIVAANARNHSYNIEILRSNVMCQCPDNLRDPLFDVRIYSNKRIQELMDKIQTCNRAYLHNEDCVQALKKALIKQKKLRKIGFVILVTGILIVLLGLFLSKNYYYGSTVGLIFFFTPFLAIGIKLLSIALKRIGTQKVEQIKEEIWNYRGKNEDISEQIEGLQKTLKDEENYKETQYFIDIMKNRV